ncbi:MAG: FKBP-type peptidyl-prolyl cis-trans isomerase [Chloroflexaceae bacterium]
MNCFARHPLRPFRLSGALLALLLLAACGAQAPAAAPTPAAERRLAATPTVTPSGLTFIEVEPGIGPHPRPGDVVDVHYRGALADGTEFDNSYLRDDPLQFVLGAGAVIPGWDEGIALMRRGGKARLIIPPQLAYGAQGAGGVIPPNATLTFEVELVDIRRNPPAAPQVLDASAFVTTPSGLKYADLEIGTGAEARPGATVVVHYTGWLDDGTRFETSLLPTRPLARQKPFEFRLGDGKVIAGWEEGVAGMRAGGLRQLVVPPGLAYGEQGAGEGKIPPGATLIFEIELLEVK